MSADPLAGIRQRLEHPSLYGRDRMLEDISLLLIENQRLLILEAQIREDMEMVRAANDRLAKIAASVSVALEQGKQDLMAHGWEVGYGNGRKDKRDGTVTSNPFRSPVHYHYEYSEDPEQEAASVRECREDHTGE